MGRLPTPHAATRTCRVRHTRRVVAALAVLLGAIVALVAPAAAQTSTSDGLTPGTFVDVFEVSGLLDPVVAGAVLSALEASEAAGAQALVLQVDSEGSVLGDDALTALVQRLATSSVPVHVWVGPSSSQAVGASAALGAVADEFAMAPGTRYGLDGATVPAPVAALAVRDLPPGVVTDAEAAELGITSFEAPTVGDFLVNLPGFETREIVDGDQTRREPITLVRFAKLSLVDSMFHAVASPAVAYLLFAIGLALFVFELFTAGVGIAGTVGAVCFILGCYGLAALPARPVAVALLVLAFPAFAVDVQTGVPRLWTGVGIVAFAVGTLFLYDGVSMSWLTIAVGMIGILLTFLSGMPSMVRTRFATPTIGRDWMIGSMGRAVTDISPDGVVQIDGAQWRATTNRATPIEQLDKVRVIGIDGLVLEVEPEEGGARDYRERRAPSADD